MIAPILIVNVPVEAGPPEADHTDRFEQALQRKVAVMPVKPGDQPVDAAIGLTRRLFEG
jgi:hypothetical protein